MSIRAREFTAKLSFEVTATSWHTYFRCSFANPMQTLLHLKMPDTGMAPRLKKFMKEISPQDVIEGPEWIRMFSPPSSKQPPLSSSAINS